MERLFRHDLFAVGQKQSHPGAPTNANQATVVAERCQGQDAGDRLIIGKSSATNLALDYAVEVMDVKIFVTLAFGVPHHRNLETLYLVKRNATDPPLHGQSIASFVQAILST